MNYKKNRKNKNNQSGYYNLKEKNGKESYRIFNLIQECPYFAISEYEEYLSKYPNDIFVKCYYAYALVCAGEMEKAESIINDINKHYDVSFFKKRMLVNARIVLLVSTIKILVHRKEYQKVLELIENSTLEEDTEDDFRDVKFFCRNRLGIEQQLSFNSYFLSQIMNYNEKLFKYHIFNHINGLHDIEEEEHFLFSEDFLLKADDIISEVKNLILANKGECIYRGILTDYYYFRYDGCAFHEGISTNLFTVITLHDSLDLITMYPTNDYAGKKIIDISYARKDQAVLKKRNSQIEKFNRKYGL